jgi:hypothetical protein
MLAVAERAPFLFGKELPSHLPAGRQGHRIKKTKANTTQIEMTGVIAEARKAHLPDGQAAPDMAEDEAIEGKVQRVGATVLDRIHQAMLLFAAGRSEALKRFVVDDGIGKDSRFWTLAQALSALYPAHTEEKRWVDGILARKKGLGF